MRDIWWNNQRGCQLHVKLCRGRTVIRVRCLLSLFPAQKSPKGPIHICGLFLRQLFQHSHRITISLIKRLGAERCKERIQRGLFEFLTLEIMYLQNVSWNMHLILRRSPGDKIIQETLWMSCKQYNLGHAILKSRQTPEKMQFYCFCQWRLPPNNSHHSCCCDSPKHFTYWEVMQKYDFIFKKIVSDPGYNSAAAVPRKHILEPVWFLQIKFI